jgi:hypothetical protein
MKTAFLPVFLFCFASAYAGPITFLTDSRYRYSNGFAEYDSTSSYLDGQKSIAWNMTSNSPFGGMDGYDLNELPVGYYQGGSGTFMKGLVGMTSQFAEGEIKASGFTSNFLGVATSGPHAEEGDNGYARLDMQSHYEITFRVNETISFDFTGSLLGDCSVSFISDNGFSLLGDDVFAHSGLLNAGVYTILADASSSLEQTTEGTASEDKQFKFDLSYHAVPDIGTTASLVGVGLIGMLAIARRRGFRNNSQVKSPR